MKNRNLYIIFTFLLAIVFFTYSCENVQVPDKEDDVDVQLAQDNALSSRVVNETFALVSAETNTKKTNLATVCYSAIYHVGTKTLTIDYGEECIGEDGVTRSGIIKAVFTGENIAWETGEKSTITFENYFRNNVKVEGTIVSTVNTLPPNSSFTVEATDMVLTFTDATNIKWSSSETTTFEKSDDNGVYWRINGSTTKPCTSRKGIVFSRTNTDLLSSPSCLLFIEGETITTVEDRITTTTFTEECGTVQIKFGVLPAITVNLLSY